MFSEDEFCTPQIQNISKSTNTSAKVKPSAVIFDLHNTIVHSIEIEMVAINKALRYHNKPHWNEGTSLKKSPSKSMKDSFIDFFDNEKDANSGYKMYRDFLLENIQEMGLMNGAIDLLKYLYDNDVKVFILSNRDQEFVDKVVEFHGISCFLTKAIGAADLNYYKPNPKLVDDIVSGFRIEKSPESVIFVGDSIADIKCAEDSGCMPVLLREIKTDVSDAFINDRAKMEPNLDILVVPNLFELKSIISDKPIQSFSKKLKMSA